MIKKIGKKFKGKGKKGKDGKDDGKDEGKPDKDGLTPADKKKHAKIAGKIKKRCSSRPRFTTTKPSYKTLHDKFQEKSLRIWSLKANSEYGYEANKMSPEEAKKAIQNFPESINSDSDQNTLLLAAILAEPSRYDVSHISNLLLLGKTKDGKESLLDSSTSHLPVEKYDDNTRTTTSKTTPTTAGAYDHTSMTRGGTDPNLTIADDYPRDNALRHPGNAGKLPPSQVTDRDLRSILLHPELADKLNKKYISRTKAKKDDATIIKDFVAIITKYMGFTRK